MGIHTSITAPTVLCPPCSILCCSIFASMAAIHADPLLRASLQHLEYFSAAAAPRWRRPRDFSAAWSHEMAPLPTTKGMTSNPVSSWTPHFQHSIISCIPQALHLTNRDRGAADCTSILERLAVNICLWHRDMPPARGMMGPLGGCTPQTTGMQRLGGMHLVAGPSRRLSAVRRWTHRPRVVHRARPTHPSWPSTDHCPRQPAPIALRDCPDIPRKLRARC